MYDPTEGVCFCSATVEVSAKSLGACLLDDLCFEIS